MSSNNQTAPGISGMALYVPALRVPLERWCEWTGNSWSKVQNVVGTSFRCCSPKENVYTMAATAVLRLIRQYDVDPRAIGQLSLGTETSTDNSAGAVIVRGMVDRALDALGMPRIGRNCEVPEFKHACLGGVYGVKGAVRYLRCDGADRRAIVVCADVAEYERGSTGEQTQGAGAVAMLLDPKARLLEVNLDHAGSSSDYRGPDFRKPHARHHVDGYASSTRRQHDFPVFSGKYSTFAYLDATLRALDDMTERMGVSALSLYEDVEALFFHRPYHYMPVQAMAYLYLRALVLGDGQAALLRDVTERAGVGIEGLSREVQSSPDLFARVLAGDAETDPYPLTTAAAAALRKSPEFRDFLARKMSLGGDRTKELGNLYTAALPAWIAAAFDEAARSERALENTRVLAVGYGSGDAAEAIPLRVADGWREAAKRIAFDETLSGAADLSQSQYEALHDGHADRVAAELGVGRQRGQFRISRVGDRQEATFQDLGVEYYEYVD